MSAMLRFAQGDAAKSPVWIARNYIAAVLPVKNVSGYANAKAMVQGHDENVYWYVSNDASIIVSVLNGSLSEQEAGL